MTDSSEIGRYGTLRLLKRHEPETTVAFFPIDDETVTFGRSKDCSVRLYYDCVSELHCTLQISDEHKAFLRVQGTNGLLVDGCQVNPSRPPNTGPTTVPLTNGSEIEIYKKRFKFEYPPKEIRAALLATPRNTKSRRSLRMSMIRSAQVFTPRASAQDSLRTPRRGSIRDNVEWEALRSPVKVLCQDTGTDKETLLLEGQGDDALVVEEEKDIIILQRVENDSLDDALASSPSKPQTRPARSVAFSIPSSTPSPRHVTVPQSARMPQQALQTPAANRRRSAPSLHRAVVLRSAQRALEREREKFEEELEESEVEAEVSPERDLGPFEAYGDDDGAEDSMDFEIQDQEDDPEPQPQPQVVPSNTPAPPPGRRMSVFKASLDAMRKVIPVSVPFGWKAPEEVPLPDEEGNEDVPEVKQDEADDDFAEIRTPVRRNLGPFMTPQVQVNRPAQRVPVDAKTRASIGGEGAAQRTFGGAQRVRVVPAWKVKDIVLPEPEKQNWLEMQQKIKKERISEEERQAIMERRKSAVHTPSLLPIPGPRSSAFPPAKQSDAYTPGEDSDEDAETMLEKMRQKMTLVRRKSEARRVRMSVGGRQQGEEFSLLASGAERHDRIPGMGIMEETLSQMKRMELIDDHLDEPQLEATGSHSGVPDQDSLNILDMSSDDDENPQHGAQHVAPGPNSSSLTPRFDGVREMFRQPHMDPKTPSFTGFRKLFQERSETSLKTPSFRGVREMFNRPGNGTVPVTPHLDLGEVFDDEEYDEREDTGSDSGDARRDTDMNNHESPAPAHRRAHKTSGVKSEDEDPVVPSTAPRTTTRARKTTTSATKKSLRKKDAPIMEIPSAVVEEQASEDEEAEEVDPTPPPGARRSVKRAVKKTTTIDTDEPSGRGKKASQGTSKGIVVHKTNRTRRVADVESESEVPTISTRKGAGRGKRAPSNQEVSENEAEPGQGDEAPAKGRSGSRKAKTAITSDSEEVEVPKARRGRPVKTPQAPVSNDEGPSAPMTTKSTRRTKIEDISEVEGLAPTAKVVKSRRGGKTKVTEIAENEDTRSPDELDGQLSEAEEITPAPRKARVAKTGTKKKTPGSKGGVSDDKENSEDPQPKPMGKTPAARTRKTPASTPLEADVPAKRTRSRK